MKISLGKDGLDKSHQENFPEQTKCCKCGHTSRIGFVAHEGIDEFDVSGGIWSLYPNDPKNDSRWIHDYCSVAIYFCTHCLMPTVLYNQS